MNYGKILALASMAALMLGCKAQALSDQVASTAVTLKTPAEKVANSAMPVLPHSDTTPSDIQLADIVKKVMHEQYGNNFNEKYQCWNYSIANSNGNNVQYCMKPSVAKFISGKTGKYIYFNASNRVDINDDASYTYSSLDTGLAGAFKLAIEESGNWKYAAANKAMDFGSMGYCGCDKSEFVKLGANDYYGWMFSSGGVWQGVTMLSHVIIAPHGNTFVNISNIPEIREEDQSTSYQIKIVDKDASKKAYPLLVSKNKQNKPSQDLLVPFNEDSRAYSLPDNF